MNIPFIRILLEEGCFEGLYIDCPECIHMEDDQYQCTTCDCGGGQGKISVEGLLLGDVEE